MKPSPPTLLLSDMKLCHGQVGYYIFRFKGKKAEHYCFSLKHQRGKKIKHDSSPYATHLNARTSRKCRGSKYAEVF